MRKIDMKRLIKDEKGHVLTLVLILLVVGGLVIAPLLSFMGTGLLAGQVYEKRTAELYAADAGVTDALWRIQNAVVRVPQCGNDPEDWSYNIADVNGKSVAVTIEYLGEETFKITSKATGDGSGTQVEAYVSGVSKYGDYSGILDNVITSQGEIDDKSEYISYPEGHGPAEYYEGDWPTAEEIAAWYWDDVKDETPYPYGTIDLDGVSMDLGPLYRDGTLEILNSNNTPATLTLTGTFYVTGDTLIGKNGKKNMILDLNEQTIFVESDSSGSKTALWIGDKVTIEGPGVIIAVGDIYFEPNIEAGMTEPIFIMSIEGTTTLKPGGDFYGAIAGSVEVELYPGTSLCYPEVGGWYDDFNFPIGIQKLIFSVASWKPSPL